MGKIQELKEMKSVQKENVYNLIFMDIDMPVMGGIEATEKIAKMKYNCKHLQQMQIICCTAYESKLQKDECKRAGADFYISKPISLAKLKAILL